MMNHLAWHRAGLRLAEKLVVEIVAAGQHHQRRALHLRMPQNARGEEEHSETLDTALRVPDHARATVARLAAALTPGTVSARLLAQHVAGLGHAAGAHRFLHRRRQLAQRVRQGRCETQLTISVSRYLQRGKPQQFRPTQVSD